jgi:hypothetical protein
VNVPSRFCFKFPPLCDHPDRIPFRTRTSPPAPGRSPLPLPPLPGTASARSRVPVLIGSFSPLFLYTYATPCPKPVPDSGDPHSQSPPLPGGLQRRPPWRRCPWPPARGNERTDLDFVHARAGKGVQESDLRLCGDGGGLVLQPVPGLDLHDPDHLAPLHTMADTLSGFFDSSGPLRPCR